MNFLLNQYFANDFFCIQQLLNEKDLVKLNKVLSLLKNFITLTNQILQNKDF